MTAFLNFCRIEKGLSANSLSAYSADLSKFTAFLGDSPAVQGPEEIRYYIDHLYGVKLSNRSIARHLTVDYLRRKKPASLDGLLNEEEGASLDPPDLRPSALQLIAQQEQAEQISAALVGIAAEYREAIVLRFQEGLALDEIAAVTGAPLGTVKSRLYRGLNALLPLLKGAQA